MAAKIVLCAVFLSATMVLASHEYKTRGDLNMGSTYGAQLIYHEIHHKYPIPFRKPDETVRVNGINNEIIKAVVVSDLEGGGISHIEEGGVGFHEVAIKLEASKRGSGYKFLVDVYA